MNSTSLDKFRKIAGLLGSEHAGERASAALKASAMLKKAGKSWTDVGIGVARAGGETGGDETAFALYEALLHDERSRTTRMAEEIGRLKREIARLKGMWPNNDTPKR